MTITRTNIPRFIAKAVDLLLGQDRLENFAHVVSSHVGSLLCQLSALALLVHHRGGVEHAVALTVKINRSPRACAIALSGHICSIMNRDREPCMPLAKLIEEA
jgi:hypothetical protein